jgi:hypothetical protein
VQSPLAAHASTPDELRQRLDAERQGLAMLVWRDARGNQRLLLLARDCDRIALGRREEADVMLDWDSEVSRLHAIVERVGGQWTVLDDGLSANGTFLGSERVQGRRRLADGDLLRLGQTLVAFRDPLAGGSKATTPGEDLATARVTEAQKRVVVALCRPYRDGPGFATPATNQQIADELHLSLAAVKSHLRGMFASFGLEDLPQNTKRTQLVERAMRTGLVTQRDLRA